MNSRKAKLKTSINGYDDVYLIDTEGNIYRNHKLMKPINNGTGYFQIKLRHNGKRFNQCVHRLVWTTFKGEVPDGYEINHIDHDKSNNSLDNLELVTHSLNLKKAFTKYGYFGSMNRPLNMQTLSQAESTLSEGAETTGEV